MSARRHPRNRMERRQARARWSRHPLACKALEPVASWRVLGMAVAHG